MHLGGAFLASHDPARLMAWFEGIGIPVERFGEGGAAMFPVGDSFSLLGIMKARPGTPAPPAGQVEREPYGRQPMMLNLRVGDLDALVDRLRQQGDDVVGPETCEGQGRFAWKRTPDGHDVELWQP